MIAGSKTMRLPAVREPPYDSVLPSSYAWCGISATWPHGPRLRLNDASCHEKSSTLRNRAAQSDSATG